MGQPARFAARHYAAQPAATLGRQTAASRRRSEVLVLRHPGNGSELQSLDALRAELCKVRAL